MSFTRIIRSLRTRLRAIMDWCALRLLMLLEHEPSNDRVELLVEPAPHHTIRVCLPRDQVRRQLHASMLH